MLKYVLSNCLYFISFSLHSSFNDCISISKFFIFCSCFILNFSIFILFFKNESNLLLYVSSSSSVDFSLFTSSSNDSICLFNFSFSFIDSFNNFVLSSNLLYISFSNLSFNWNTLSFKV